jgi:hypothetical protein
MSAHVDSGRRQGLRSDSGYSLVELLVSSAVMLTVTGAIFGLMNPAQGTTQAQTEVADMQQRMRVASDAIFKELVMAGAGVYQGAQTGSLLNFFAPILPRRGGDGPNVFRDDALLLTYIPNNYSQTTISNSMPPNASELKVTDVPNCPKHDQLCGFEAGMVVIIFDDAGHFDTFEITKVQDDAAHLQHQGYDLNYEFQTGSHITQGSRAGFYRDSTTNQLRKTNGWTGNTPLVDDMVDLKFAYFGDPNPPKYPKPDAGEANCLYDASGNLLPMPVLPLSDGSLSALTGPMLTDGPFCGAGLNQYDADLLRIRKIRATLRMQVASSSLRGANTSLWTNPGKSPGGGRSVPDYTVTFEMAPRNLNLSR